MLFTFAAFALILNIAIYFVYDFSYSNDNELITNDMSEHKLSIDTLITILDYQNDDLISFNQRVIVKIDKVLEVTIPQELTLKPIKSSQLSSITINYNEHALFKATVFDQALSLDDIMELVEFPIDSTTQFSQYDCGACSPSHNISFKHQYIDTNNDTIISISDFFKLSNHIILSHTSYNSRYFSEKSRIDFLQRTIPRLYLNS